MTNSFFKKYGKLLMAFVGSLLMVAFVLQISSGGGGSGRNPAGVPEGTLDGKPITLLDVQRASADLDILPAFLAHSSNFYNPLNMAYYTLKYMLNGDEPALHMYLLLTEAQKYGIVVSSQEVDQMIRDAAVSDADYESFLETNHLSQNSVRGAVEDVLMIQRLEAFALETLPVSLPELRHLAVDTTATMQVQYITMDTAGAAKLDWTPLPEDQQKQFDAYKDVLPADVSGTPPPLIDGHHYPFGYKYPDRIKLEVLTFDWRQVRNTLKATTDDYLQARDEYNAHPESYQRPVPATLPDKTIGPATRPATAPATQESAGTQPFDEVSGEIIKEILDHKTDQKIKQMTDAANAELRTAWDRFQSDDKGFYSVPPSQWPDYESIARDIQKQFGVLPKVESYGKEWLSREDIARNLKDGIGGAVLMTQGQSSTPVPFVELAMNVHELQPQQQGLVASLHLQVGVDGPVVVDADNTAYIYRVIAASSAHDPASLQEVQAAVIRDLRRKAVYDSDIRRGRELSTEAARVGLVKVAQQTNYEVQLTPDFTRLRPVGEALPPDIKPLGVVPEFSNATFDLMVRSVEAQQETAAPVKAGSATQPAATNPSPAAATEAFAAALANAPPAYQTTVVPVDSRLNVFVMQLFKSDPATLASFDLNRDQLINDATRNQMSTFLRKWDSLEQTAKRLHFVPAKPFKSAAS